MSNQTIMRLELDGIVTRARKLPVPDSGDISDSKCPDCKHCGEWTFMLDVTQHGFGEDKIATIGQCRNCFSLFYWSYIIEHDYIDLGD